ncbi:GNAT family N-acetyltransferase [Pseudoneobacillus sp. C159]
MISVDYITYKIIEDLAEINEVVGLQTEIWSASSVSPLPHLLASIHHGGIIIGAFNETELIGFCYGFTGFKNGQVYLVSHMAAVKQPYQNYGIGYQLKLKQREWAVKYGYPKIVWTYDPLEVRNGYFNLNKLGAYSRKYHVEYYGEMEDKLNKGLPSDRLLIEWDIHSERVAGAITGSLLKPNVDGYEILQDGQKFDAQKHGFLVPAPANIQFVKQTAMEEAQKWRISLRNTLSMALAKGYAITGVHKQSDSITHYYILENGEKI